MRSRHGCNPQTVPHCLSLRYGPHRYQSLAQCTPGRGGRSHPSAVASRPRLPSTTSWAFFDSSTSRRAGTPLRIPYRIDERSNHTCVPELGVDIRRRQGCPPVENAVRPIENLTRLLPCSCVIVSSGAIAELIGVGATTESV
jgi:hypothetical protein